MGAYFPYPCHDGSFKNNACVWCVCVYVCAHVCACLHVYVHMCECRYICMFRHDRGGLRLVLDVFFNLSPLYFTFFETIFLLTLALTNSPRLAAQLIPGCAGITGGCLHNWVFPCGFWGPRLRSSCLCRGCFTLSPNP